MRVGHYRRGDACPQESPHVKKPREKEEGGRHGDDSARHYTPTQCTVGWVTGGSWTTGRRDSRCLTEKKPSLSCCAPTHPSRTQGKVSESAVGSASDARQQIRAKEGSTVYILRWRCVGGHSGCFDGLHRRFANEARMQIPRAKVLRVGATSRVRTKSGVFVVVMQGRPVRGERRCRDQCGAGKIQNRPMRRVRVFCVEELGRRDGLRETLRAQHLLVALRTVQLGSSRRSTGAASEGGRRTRTKSGVLGVRVPRVEELPTVEKAALVRRDRFRGTLRSHDVTERTGGGRWSQAKNKPSLASRSHGGSVGLPVAAAQAGSTNGLAAASIALHLRLRSSYTSRPDMLTPRPPTSKSHLRSALRSGLWRAFSSPPASSYSGSAQNTLVPVYTIWGACEDVLVIEKFRSGSHAIENLHLLDEATTRCLDLGDVKLRLLGLGGALVPHKMSDNGDGNATIAGGQGTMWTTALQIGELIDTAQRVFDPTKTRLLVTHASPGREGIMAQLALVLKADLTVSAGLHFRCATSYEFSVQGDFDGFCQKLTAGKEGFDKVWESVKTQVDAVIDDNQRVLLDKALSVVERLSPAEDPAWKNCWNWNLCGAAYGSLVLDVKEGRISAELKSQAYRRTATVAATPNSHTSALPAPKSTTPVRAPSHLDGSTPSTPASTKPNGLTSAEKAERERLKKKEKKERRPSIPFTNSAAANSAASASSSVSTTPPNPLPGSASARVSKLVAVAVDGGGGGDVNGDKDRERAEKAAAGPESGPAAESASAAADAPAPADSESKPARAAKELKSSLTDSGARTPKTARPLRNPWTIFMKMAAGTTVNDADIREFFGEAKGGHHEDHAPAAVSWAAAAPRVYRVWGRGSDVRGLVEVASAVEKFPGDRDRLGRMSLIEEGFPKQGAASCSDLVKSTILKDFVEFEGISKFGNVTNGSRTPARPLSSSAHRAASPYIDAVRLRPQTLYWLGGWRGRGRAMGDAAHRG
ncbi:hypothetical protein C8J57DRAFT_1479579 [Mycena rebaudengoi]|nr:hypothetical protein C8J57DRAFT_1479579 [Mycena rebaudengoi]